jgi:hypothetical protein
LSGLFDTLPLILPLFRCTEFVQNSNRSPIYFSAGREIIVGLLFFGFDIGSSDVSVDDLATKNKSSNVIIINALDIKSVKEVQIVNVSAVVALFLFLLGIYLN